MESVEQVIRRRGSTRRFNPVAIGEDALRTMLTAAMRPVPGDWPSLDGGPVNTLYLIVNDVEGLEPGGYVYHPKTGNLEMLRSGEHRYIAGHLGLNQALAHDAAVNCYFLTDLDDVTATMGARGYRAAQLDASIRAGRLYLSAYSLGLGATGLTFFDDEVTQSSRPTRREERDVPDAAGRAAEASAGDAGVVAISLPAKTPRSLKLPVFHEVLGHLRHRPATKRHDADQIVRH